MKKQTYKTSYQSMSPKFTFYSEQTSNDVDQESILTPDELDFPDQEYYEFDDLNDK